MKAKARFKSNSRKRNQFTSNYVLISDIISYNWLEWARADKIICVVLLQSINKQ